MEQSNSNQLTVRQEPRELSAFSGGSAFESAQRMAKALASSDLVPKEYKGNIANCLVALEISQRTGSSALAVMQSLNIIHGRPSWSSQYIIAALNSCGRFSPLRFEMTGDGDKRQCMAWAIDKSDGAKLEGPVVSMAMAKAEGWLGKSGSKWATMPELMLRYRAASFFGRLYAPDILMGMQSDDEVRDVTPGPQAPKPDATDINSEIKNIRRKNVNAVSHDEAVDKSKPVDEQIVTEGSVDSVASNAGPTQSGESEEFF